MRATAAVSANVRDSVQLKSQVAVLLLLLLLWGNASVSERGEGRADELSLLDVAGVE